MRLKMISDPQYLASVVTVSSIYEAESEFSAVDIRYVIASPDGQILQRLAESR